MPTPLSPIHTAAQNLAAPGVVTQYTDKGRTKHQVQCLRLGSLAISDNMLFSREGEYVQGFVYLADMRALRIESRRSFKHPIIGAVLGIVLLAGAIFLFSAAFAGFNWAPKADIPILGEIFLALLGAFTLWEVLRNRRVPFLVIDTKDETRAFELHGPHLQPMEQLVEALHAAVSNP